jgi:hypothetical protein
MKFCKYCSTERDYKFFHKDKKQKDGFYPKCKFCRSPSTKEKVIKTHQRAEKLESLNISENQKYCNKCETLKNTQDFHKNSNACKPCRKKPKKESELTEVGKHRRRVRELTKHLTPEQRKQRTKEVDRIRRQRPQIKIADQLRKRMNMALKHKCKRGSAVRDLGCSIEEFISYLESKFKPGMSWNNYGLNGWHIDHIIPLAKFDLEKS